MFICNLLIASRLHKGRHHFLGHSTSKSFQESTEPWEQHYISGEFVHGVKVAANIDVGGISLKLHEFGGATVLSDFFIKSTADGVLGLAHSHTMTKVLSAQHLLTPVEDMSDAGVIDPIVSFKIRSPEYNDGQVTFG
jgi:hypothetical protein